MYGKSDLGLIQGQSLALARQITRGKQSRGMATSLRISYPAQKDLSKEMIGVVKDGCAQSNGW